MPIRPENKTRYPKDWPAISKKVREEAGNRCETCKAPNGEVVIRGAGQWDGTYMVETGEVFDHGTGEFKGYARGSEYYGRAVKIVLTVAHLDHQPENCAPENLKALCQRCHLRLDAKSKAERRRARERSDMACRDLL